MFKLKERLDALADVRDPQYLIGDLVAELEASGEEAPRFIAEMFDFMERYPDVDMGVDSPLCEYIAKRNYIEDLLGSLRRRPTIYTSSMLFRLIDSTVRAEDIERYMTELSAAKSHPAAESYVCHHIQEFQDLFD